MRETGTSARLVLGVPSRGDATDRGNIVESSHSSVRRDDDPCTTLSLPFDPASVRIARKQMVADFADRGFRQTFIDDAELVMAELAANGIAHGRPNSRHQIDVSWCIEPDVVRISVCDSGSSDHLKAIPFNDTSLRGRGLAIVEHLCESWHVDTADGLRVTAELRYEQSHQPA